MDENEFSRLKFAEPNGNYFNEEIILVSQIAEREEVLYVATLRSFSLKRYLSNSFGTGLKPTN